MQLSKFEHACFTITIDGQTLVVDPGSFTSDFIVPEHTVGIVITHQHADHQNTTLIRSILDKSPDAILYTTDDTTLDMESPNVRKVAPGEQQTTGPFSLEFFGGNHATIDSSLSPIHNVGVMINDLVYYSGDSFDGPGRPVKILALPVVAPWMKISEALDFLREIQPEIAFPVHDAILNNNGKGVVDRLAGNVATDNAILYKRLVDPLVI